ncbi:hypothetical protein [Nostoc sp. FACHB-110]|nr:hypothetical protein [Nostoc sp. FACHB-110]MBD2438291.1 hypothetical protein [Nostoc sp. FACHB-110]
MRAKLLFYLRAIDLHFGITFEEQAIVTSTIRGGIIVIDESQKFEA